MSQPDITVRPRAAAVHGQPGHGGPARRWALRRLAVVLDVLDGWSHLLMAVLFGVGVLVVLSTQPIGQNADGLIQTLFSIQRLTLFYWGQDRFANLLPLLAMPVQDPHLNALAQLALRVALGLLAPLFFCLLAARDTGSAWRATLAASTLFLAFAPQRMVHEALVEASPYGTSFALVALALLLFRKARDVGQAGGQVLLAAGLVLTCAAYLVNMSLVLITAPLLAGEAALFGSALAIEFGLASLLGVGVAAALMGAAATAGPTSMRFAETSVGLLYFGRLLLGKTGLFLLGSIVAVPGVALLLGLRGRAAGVRRLLGHGATLTGTFVASLVLISLSSWVVMNYLHPRYLVPSFFLASALGGLSLVHLADGLVRDRVIRNLAVLGTCAMLLAVAGRRHPLDGAPLGTIVDPMRSEVAGAVAGAVQQRGLDGIAGDYWDVWPAVFEAEQIAHDTGQPAGQVFGITYRGEVRRAAFVARLLGRGRLDFACIGGDSGRCNAMLLGVMVPPAVEMREVGQPQRLPDGRMLSFFSVESPRAADGGPWR